MIKNDSILLQLTADDVLVLGSLYKIAKEAIEHSKLINEKYKFIEGQEKIVVWDDGYNRESITSDGVWHGEYLSKHYTVECSNDGIYRLYRDQYIYNNNYNKEKYFEEQARVAANFREFVKHTRIMK